MIEGIVDLSEAWDSCSFYHWQAPTEQCHNWTHQLLMWAGLVMHTQELHNPCTWQKRSPDSVQHGDYIKHLKVQHQLPVLVGYQAGTFISRLILVPVSNHQPDWYDLRQFQSHISTCLVRTWGKYQPWILIGTRLVWNFQKNPIPVQLIPPPPPNTAQYTHMLEMQHQICNKTDMKVWCPSDLWSQKVGLMVEWKQSEEKVEGLFFWIKGNSFCTLHLPQMCGACLHLSGKDVQDPSQQFWG